MRIKFLRPPPLPEVAVSWRDLYVAGRFAQRDVTWASNFSTWARERSLSLGVGHTSLERLDRAGTFQPIFFSLEGYFGGALYAPEAVEQLAFREDLPARPWENYAWDAYGIDEITALYSPWQLLYLEDALDGASADFPVETLLSADPGRGEAIDSLRVLLEGQHGAWQALDAGWRPLIKLLVRLQNHYWPRVSGRVGLVPDGADGYAAAGPESADESIDPKALLAELALSSEDVLAAYHLLVERGLDLDPRDGLTVLRRARPRALHGRWRGSARRAQDCFDAAEMLRQFLIDIHRKNPPAPDAQPIDGRQLERAALYENGPAPTVDEQGLKELLADAQLLTAGVLVICEGASEQIVIEGLVAAAVGPHALRSLRFHDLGGSGGAIRIQGLLDTFGPAMLASFVVVDREGQMGQYLAAASRNGAVAAEDVQLCDDSLEADNATPEELIRLVTELGRMPPQRPGTQLPEPAELRLTVQELEDYHRGRRERSSKNSLPGLADSLLTLARRPEHGSVNVEKLDLVEALTQKLISEIEATSGGALVQLKKRRPIVGFVLDRIAARVDRPRNL